METLYNLVRFLHFMSFVFMSVPLFNLIVVNERELPGVSFNYLPCGPMSRATANSPPTTAGLYVAAAGMQQNHAP